MNSDNHPISILHRLRRRVRQKQEIGHPNRFTHNMSTGLSSENLSDNSIEQRLQSYVAQIPFADSNFRELITQPDREGILRSADTARDHHFELLGSGPVKFGHNIDWHRESVTGFRWNPNVLYSRVNALTPPGSDIKHPWELSRCQHFSALGLAWQLTDDEGYLREYVNETVDWISSNRVGYGVNWVCAMEVAIRAVNWLAGYSLLQEALQKSEHTRFRRELTLSLWEHARFISTHLEWNGPHALKRANHFLANLTGLFTLGVFFSDTAQGSRWLRFARRYLEVEMARQVLDDGVHFERATSYHRLCLEMFLWCWSLGKGAGVHFSDAYQQRLWKMQEFVRAYIRPDGSAPVCGDNDDGRLLYSGASEIKDHRYLSSLTTTDVPNVDRILLAGSTTPQPEQQNTGSISSAFRTAGYYFLNGSGYSLMIRAGALAHNGTHAHCDQLSFELTLGTESVFVDRGSYVYTSDVEMRNRYRGTTAHNVLSLNGAGQNRQLGNVFGLYDDTQTQVLNISGHTLQARHTGFKSLARPDVAHTRTFLMDLPGNGIEITDEIESVQDGDIVEWYFHLAPGLTSELLGNRMTVRRGDKAICILECPGQTSLRIERFDHSPSYGYLQEAATLFVTRRIEDGDTPYRGRFLISFGENI